MSLIKQFNKYINDNGLFSAADKLLLAVSGGLDSVVLCELCKQSGFDFAIVHCNFQLRGEESSRDEHFTRSLGMKYEVEVFVKKFDTEKEAKKLKQSIQVAARELRYHWFEELRSSVNGHLSTKKTPRCFILTAHHLDDSIETSMMNYYKGTGIAGLRGILPKHGNIIRPLLFARKEDLLSFAKQQGLQWVEDSSNASDKYSRNYFRNQLLPLVKNIYPEAAANLADNLQRFRDTELLYLQAIDQHKKQLLENKGNEVHIPILKLKKAIPLYSILYEIIRDYGFSAAQTNEVIAILDSEAGKYVQSNSHRIIKNRAWLIIAPIDNTVATTLVVEGEGKWSFPLGNLQIRTGPTANSISQTANQILLDHKEIHFPLLLRPWKQGDYFYPLGMTKKKKLSRFFIDQKLSRTDKEKVWVLEMDKKIIWVVGQRIDERFKVKDNTKQVLQFNYTPL